MKTITISRLYDLSEVLGVISSQQMPLEQASDVADFIEAVAEKFLALESERMEIVSIEDEKDKNEKLSEFGGRKVEVPEISFKGFSLRLTPNHVQILKACELF